ncbi:uncharacterized protein BO95DRAFT_270456 [Aspergillus brunneoviolaceus CBS 621.78]|uniref:Uncharacterized protein n=1 Tax=Aspergillus brunneoviolaceus CBS 621.78 TaxID=1450534 RepID=A0ACD1GKU7_9EURO|nr:hypothetical protein BO95DRAFT_270456 [Aspergillus brunneoviolaceus CBS 621.78]RAH49681.1 hypothetical protein BO95DRAFT_270456 [Aspergillus brunneoviolaceus CBS 621.78]
MRIGRAASQSKLVWTRGSSISVSWAFPLADFPVRSARFPHRSTPALLLLPSMDGALWMGVRVCQSVSQSVSPSVCLSVYLSVRRLFFIRVPHFVPLLSSCHLNSLVSFLLFLSTFFLLSHTHTLSHPSSRLTAFASAVRFIVLPYCFPLACIKYRRVLFLPCLSKPLINPMHN